MSSQSPLKAELSKPIIATLVYTYGSPLGGTTMIGDDNKLKNYKENCLGLKFETNNVCNYSFKSMNLDV